NTSSCGVRSSCQRDAHLNAARSRPVAKSANVEPAVSKGGRRDLRPPAGVSTATAPNPAHDRRDQTEAFGNAGARVRLFPGFDWCFADKGGLFTLYSLL